jgi:archaellum component FlaG (FlaF/FlaG flagellin family)
MGTAAVMAKRCARLAEAATDRQVRASDSIRQELTITQDHLMRDVTQSALYRM